MGIRIVRVYHAGRSPAHRARERALAASGADVTLVVPDRWGDGGESDQQTITDSFRVVQLDVVRPGDVNRHRYARSQDLAAVFRDIDPDVIDVHEEPFSHAMRQVLSVVPAHVPVVAYSAQNLDKRYPPPFTRWERQAFSRISLMYPCSRQAAAVVRRRGFAGPIRVLPLGYDDTVFLPGNQVHEQEPFRVALVGRLVPEKGVRDALAAFAAVRKARRAVMSIAGDGPEAAKITSYCKELNVPTDSVERHPWLSEAGVAALYARSHLMLAPSLSTSRIVEQFGRMVPEAQASGCVVAAYATGSIPEVAAGAAWLSVEGDSLGLSRAATELATSSDQWRLLREAGLLAARDKTWAEVAARQIEAYAVAANASPPRQARVRRQPRAATEEFGSPARVHGLVSRPFALPLLRTSRLAPRIADFIDGEARAQARESS